MARQGSASGWVVSCAALLIASGCGRPVTYRDPTRSATWTELGRAAEADSVEIVLATGDRHPVRDARFAPDSTRWTDPSSGDPRVAASMSLSRVSMQDEGRGIRRGLTVGVAVGGLLSALVNAAASGMDPGPPKGAALSVTLVVTGITGLVGAALGGTGGWEDVVLEEDGDPEGGP